MFGRLKILISIKSFYLFRLFQNVLFNVYIYKTYTHTSSIETFRIRLNYKDLIIK